MHAPSAADRHARFLFAVLLAMCALVGVLFVLGEHPTRELVRDGATITVSETTGIAHPRIAGMRAGGDGAARHGRLLWLGGGFLVLTILLAAGGLSLGLCAPAGHRGVAARSARRWIVAGTLAGVGTATAIFVAYSRSLAAGVASYPLGFPAASSWMVWGVWLFPFIFVAGFVRCFDRSYVTGETLDRFAARLAAVRAHRADPQAARGSGSQDSGAP